MVVQLLIMVIMDMMGRCLSPNETNRIQTVCLIKTNPNNVDKFLFSKYVAANRGSVHVAPLVGHVQSVSSKNLEPAPGTTW